MTYNVAQKLNEVVTLDKDFNITIGNTKIVEPMQKGYIYANLFFYDELQKEIEKLRTMIEKVHTECTLELGIAPDDVMKLVMEICTRVARTIGNDGLDALVKEFLGNIKMHIALMPDDKERSKFSKVCEAIMIELCQDFYKTTMAASTPISNGMRMFKFSRAYIASLTERQIAFLAPALRVIGLENKAKLSNLGIADDWTVRYVMEAIDTNFGTQEENIKAELKKIIKTM